MFANQRARSVAERHAGMHRVRREQAASQRPLAARAQQPRKLFEVDRHALLVAVGARSTDGENPQCLGATIECRHQMPVDLVRCETLRLVRAKKPVCDEDGALAHGGIRDQIRIDPHRNVQADMLGVREHEVAQIDALGRRCRDGLGFLLQGSVGKNLVRGVEDGVLAI